MSHQGAVCWVLLTTVLCGAVSAAGRPAHLAPGSPGPEQMAPGTLPRLPERPLLLARNHQRERRRDRERERRRDREREQRQAWRRERRRSSNAAVAAGIGGLIVGGIVGAAAASAQRQSYRQSISDFPNYQ